MYSLTTFQALTAIFTHLASGISVPNRDGQSVDDYTSTLSLTKRNNASGNWCGAIKQSSKVSSVEAKWTVVAPTVPSGGSESTEYLISQWVGIDGVSSCSALLQAGTLSTIKDGKTTTNSWYEFYPAGAVNTNVTVSVGDEMYVKVSATSPKKGTIYIENSSTGDSVTEYPVSSQGSLCQDYAVWTVEHPGDDGTFPEFQEFELTGCEAATSDGSDLSLDGSDLNNLVESGSTLCSSIMVSSSELKLTHG